MIRKGGSLLSSPELLQRQDPEVARLIEEEQERQRTTLQLIASENFASRAVMKVLLVGRGEADMVSGAT